MGKKEIIFLSFVYCNVFYSKGFCLMRPYFTSSSFASRPWPSLCILNHLQYYKYWNKEGKNRYYDLIDRVSLLNMYAL